MDYVPLLLSYTGYSGIIHCVEEYCYCFGSVILEHRAVTGKCLSLCQTLLCAYSLMNVQSATKLILKQNSD
ncbi:hypothetical protein ANTRET_LOCUS9364 [Anthophora retusa]